MTNRVISVNGRTAGIAALIESYFSCTWFGWGQADPPRWMFAPLLAGSIVALVTMTLAVVVILRSKGQHTPLQDRVIRRRYLFTVAIEICVLGIGAAVLAASGEGRWIAVWVCAGVGIHFFPLSRALRDLMLVPFGAVITAVAVVAMAAGLTTDVSPSTITGPGAGICLLAAAWLTLGQQRRQARVGSRADLTVDHRTPAPQRRMSDRTAERL